MSGISRLFFVLGIILILIGGAVHLLGRWGWSLDKLPLGKLPGDIRFESEHYTCVFPLATSILLSILITLLLNLIIRILGR